MRELASKRDIFRTNILAGKASTNTVGLEITLNSGEVLWALEGREVLSGLFWSSWANIMEVLTFGRLEAFEPFSGCLKMLAYSSPAVQGQEQNRSEGVDFLVSLADELDQTTYGFLLGTIVIMDQYIISKIRESGVKEVMIHFPTFVGTAESKQIRISMVRFSKITGGDITLPSVVEDRPMRFYRLMLAEAGFHALWNFDSDTPTSRKLNDVISALRLGTVMSFKGSVNIPSFFTSLFFPSTESKHEVLSELIEKNIRTHNRVIIVGKSSAITDPAKSDIWRVDWYDELNLEDPEIDTGIPAVAMAHEKWLPKPGSKEIRGGEYRLPAGILDPDKVLRVLEYRTYEVKVSADFPEMEFVALRAEGTKAFHLAPGKSFLLATYPEQKFYKIFVLSWAYHMYNAEGKPASELELVGIVNKKEMP